MKPIIKLYRPSWNIGGIEIDRYSDGTLEDYCYNSINKKMKREYPHFLERIVKYKQKKEIRKDIWNRMKKIVELNGLDRMCNQSIEECFSIYSDKEKDLKQKFQNLNRDFREIFNVELKTKFIYLK
ncbi:hypothetical protein ISS04_03810 [Candidatus Woesearchaeota archaeon]|nr:hypothetical protein [Candidatus Woesearchaeota archaeon]